jgi:hypothetical protein
LVAEVGFGGEMAADAAARFARARRRSTALAPAGTSARMSPLLTPSSAGRLKNA